MHNFMHNATILNEPASPALGKGGEAVLKRIRNDDTRSLTKKPNPREFNDPADSLLGCGSVSKAPLMRNQESDVRARPSLDLTKQSLPERPPDPGSCAG